MAGEHFAQTEGYQRYAETAALLRQVGLEAAAEGYASVALCGTPDQLLRQIAGIKDALGDFQLIVIPSFGGMPYEQANASLELFAKEVMPGTRELQG
jgi:alkanesulfonate monooxygenase SsuD/methylene tetrahydromethanopterin reductase-like flavin-dependent oxidoreductase (luciferase family)